MTAGADRSHDPPLDHALAPTTVQRFVDEGPIGFIVNDDAGRILAVNATLCSWLDRARADLLERVTLQDLLPAGDRIYYDTHVRPLLHVQDEIKEIALEMVRPDGSRLPVLISSMRREDADGTMLTETAVFDARERRMYERQLLEQRQKVERSEARLQLLYDVVAGMSRASTTSEILEVITDGGAYTSSGAGCTVWLFDEDHGAIRVNGATPVAVGVPDRIGWETPGPGLAELADGGLIVIEDISADGIADHYPLIHRWLTEAQRRSAIIAPLMVRGALIGVLTYGFTEPHVFDADERRDVGSLAFQTTEALRRARLHEADLRSRARSERRRQISAALNRALTTDEVAATLTVDDAAAFGAELVAVFMLTGDETHRLAATPPSLNARLGGRDLTINIDAPAVREAITKLIPVHREECDCVVELGAEDDTTTGFKAVSVLPLVDAGVVAGVVVALSTDPHISAAERVALSGVSAEASIAIGRARRYETERSIAVTLQEAMLPEAIPAIPGWKIDAHYSPGSADLVVGGDLYDVLEIEDEKFAMVIADIVGHGLAAAATMGGLRSVASSLALGTGRPSEVIAGLDRYASITPGARSASVCSVILNRSGEGTYSVAGHPYPVVVTPDGTVQLLRDGRSALLGTSRLAPLDDAPLSLAPGSTLVLYTDGLIERREESMTVGFDRLQERVGQIDFTKRSPAKRITQAMTRDTERRDDIVVVTATRLIDRGGG